MTLPAPILPQVSTGKVRWRAAINNDKNDGVLDGAVSAPTTGTVTFVPGTSELRYLDGGSPVTLFLEPSTFEIGADGVLREDGNDWVTLIADAANPMGWTYTVRAVVNGIRWQEFSFHLGPDEDVNLTAVAPVPVSAGEWYIQGPQGPPGGPFTTEDMRDLIAATLVAGANVTIVNNDAADTVTIASTGGGAAYTDEQVRDVIGATLVAGTNVTITPNDAGDTVTISSTGGGTSYTDEQVRDVVGATLVAGSNVTVTPNDAGDIITIASTGGTSYTDEQVRDVVGATLVAGANVTITPDDAGDTITIASSGGGAVASVSGRTGAVTLTKTDVGLSNVDNTADASKPISTATQTALNLKADKLADEAVVYHDGTAGGGTRPTGFKRIRWVNPVGTAYGRPTNMLTGDIWEHDA